MRPVVLELEGRRLLSAFDVTSTADDGGTGTLRWAVGQANAATSASTIDFTLASTPAVITLTSGQLTLTNTAYPTTIDGPGASLLSVSGNNASRVFQVDKGVTASISGLTITGGLVKNFHPGAGLYNDGGSVSLTGCTISDNKALFTSSGIINGFQYSTGGGIYSKGGAVTLSGSTVTGNYAYANGGGLESNGGSATLTDCTISGNSSHLFGGGLGNGSDDTATLSGCTFSGNSAYSGSGMQNYGAASLTDCTISGGTTQGGGGSLNNDGTATLGGCAFSDNAGSGLENGDYFHKSAALTLSACTVTGNTDSGLENEDGTSTLSQCTLSENQFDGALNDGTVTLDYCAINGNTGRAALENNGTDTLTGCTISGNDNGGISNFGKLELTYCTISDNVGGGLYDNSGTATLTDCTISGNSAQFGGGVDNVGGSIAALIDCTINGNSAGRGGGLSNQGTVTLVDTILAANTLTNSTNPSDINGTVTGSNNLIGTGGSGGLVNGTNGNIVLTSLTSLNLAPLGNYGGPTETIALLPGCPAIGAGASVTGVTTDQRGAPRPSSGPTDIGAFQDQGYTLAVSSGSGQTANVGQAFAAPLVAQLTENFAASPLPGATITFTAPASGASATLSATTVTTDSEGLASVTATANSATGAYNVSASTSGPTETASFALNNSNGPVNVTSDISVNYGGFLFNRTKHEFTQSLTIINTSSAAINGPIVLVLQNLKNATLVNESGTTAGDPYVTILSSGSLGAGQNLVFTLIFEDPTFAPITYTSEFLAGALPSTTPPSNILKHHGIFCGAQS